MKTSTHLRKARALVNKGWCKGTYDMVNKEGVQCYCATGALGKVNNPLGYEASWQYLNNVIKTYESKTNSEYLPRDHGVVVFNDARFTTKKDVLAVFDLAIKKAVEDETKVR